MTLDAFSVEYSGLDVPARVKEAALSRSARVCVMLGKAGCRGVDKEAGNEVTKGRPKRS